MFGIDVEKIVIIATVALIVIGPERLPRVARTLGTLFGRMQRYMADVRAEVSREMQLDELRNVGGEVRQAVSKFSAGLQNEVEQSRSNILAAVSGSGENDAATLGGVATPLSPSSPFSPSKRNRWRRNRAARQSATPQWYRQSQRRKTRVLSAAARVARYRSRGTGS